jgi:hypothetical protein
LRQIQKRYTDYTDRKGFHRPTASRRRSPDIRLLRGRITSHQLPCASRGGCNIGRDACPSRGP